jgi:hypothetical protein
MFAGANYQAGGRKKAHRRIRAAGFQGKEGCCCGVGSAPCIQAM